MISDLSLITKRLMVPSSFGRRDGLRDFFEQYPDGVYVATDYGAPAGWEGYSVYFGGTSESLTGWFETMLRDVYVVERLFRTRVSGVLVLTFRCRLKARIVTVGKGRNPLDDWWGLKLTMPNGGTVILRKTGSPNALSLEVSTDAVNWQPWELVGTDYTYTLSAGQTLCVRNTSNTFVSPSIDTNNYWNFVLSDETHASGSITSIAVNDENYTSLSPYCYINMFRGCTSLVTAPELPAQTLASYCYRYMFRGCTSLERAPELPAQTLADNCYRDMFRDCTSLERAPELPAQTLASYCYRDMFRDCTSLEFAPELPAQTLAINCYFSMFRNCISLNYIYTLMTDISATDCLTSWLDNVYATGDFHCPQELTIPTGASGIPSGWTRHDI